MRPKRRRRMMMKVEETENLTDNTNNTCNETDEPCDPNKTVKNEEGSDTNETISDGDNKVINGTCNSSTKENEIPTTTKIEDVSNGSDGDDIVKSNCTENNCENSSTNKPSGDTKNPFKICRLCLVFVDDNFVPLEKVMVMLQIVLPEVVSNMFLRIF